MGGEVGDGGGGGAEEEVGGCEVVVGIGIREGGVRGWGRLHC